MYVILWGGQLIDCVWTHALKTRAHMGWPQKSKYLMFTNYILRMTDIKHLHISSLYGSTILYPDLTKAEHVSLDINFTTRMEKRSVDIQGYTDKLRINMIRNMIEMIWKMKHMKDKMHFGFNFKLTYIYLQ